MQCHLLSFEGSDSYAQAGGLASRVSGLSNALVHTGFDTHLWFVGDPQLPGSETRDGLHLHRWCQWISRYYPEGVYAGEEGKQSDYAASLPPFLFERFLLPDLAQGHRALVMAEEWHTVNAVLHLDWLLQKSGTRQQVTILWNANNTFGFDRIDWERLRKSAIITTVSRYMKGLMQRFGVEPIIISNGLANEAYLLPNAEAVNEVRQRTRGRTIVAKVGRWDPAKRWEHAIETVAVMKSQGWRPLLVARGGKEPYGGRILWGASTLGLRVMERGLSSVDERGVLNLLDGLDEVDVVNLVTALNPTVRGLLFSGADAVLANSTHEPFGLVGLEAMAVEGVACIGNTGEDYAIPGYNTLVVETEDPWEFMSLYGALKNKRGREQTLRHAARRTAHQYAWPKIIQRVLLPKLAALESPRSAPPRNAA